MFWKKFIFLFIIISFSFFYYSCKKEKSSVVFSNINSGTDFNLYSIRKLRGDSIIACGGKNNQGILLLSKDRGNMWKTLNSTFDQVIYDVYFVNENLGFAVGATPDVFKTTDKGLTWEKLYIPFPDFPLAYRVPLRKIFFINDSTGFICGGGKFGQGIIFKTTDQGQTWKLSLFEHELRDILFTNQTSGFACGYGAIFNTTDCGNTWKVLKTPNEFYTSLIKYGAQLWTAGYNGGIFNSVEEDMDWKAKNSSNNAFNAATHFNCLVATENGILIAAGNDGILSISRDMGNSWAEGESFNGTTIRSIILTSNNSGMAVGNEGKIYTFLF